MDGQQMCALCSIGNVFATGEVNDIPLCQIHLRIAAMRALGLTEADLQGHFGYVIIQHGETRKTDGWSGEVHADWEAAEAEMALARGMTASVGRPETFQYGVLTPIETKVPPLAWGFRQGDGDEIERCEHRGAIATMIESLRDEPGQLVVSADDGRTWREVVK